MIGASSLFNPAPPVPGVIKRTVDPRRYVATKADEFIFKSKFSTGRDHDSASDSDTTIMAVQKQDIALPPNEPSSLLSSMAPCILIHGNMAAENVIVDEDFNVKAIVINLGFAEIIPLQFSTCFPNFSTHEFDSLHEPYRSRTRKFTGDSERGASAQELWRDWHINTKVEVLGSVDEESDTPAQTDKTVERMQTTIYTIRKGDDGKAIAHKGVPARCDGRTDRAQPRNIAVQPPHTMQTPIEFIAAGCLSDGELAYSISATAVGRVDL
ncbi:hypothetical protein V493_00899 [Pseudogymnoascus sp. VKM F-4281 (FW-2241)]|nr:hypothetical protein V493_00899 [Pseudogymnoascus sp. VKM F-4281 (FW-2241)]